MLLLLSRFSHVRLSATPETAAHQAPPSLGFSRKEHWSGSPFPSPVHESESEIAQLYPTLSDPMDCSPPGPSVRGIFPARVLEWGTIAFSLVLISLLKFLTQLIIFLLFIKMQSTTTAVNETWNLSSLSTKSTYPLVYRFHCYLPVHTRSPTFIEDQLLFEWESYASFPHRKMASAIVLFYSALQSLLL